METPDRSSILSFLRTISYGVCRRNEAEMNKAAAAFQSAEELRPTGE